MADTCFLNGTEDVRAQNSAIVVYRGCWSGRDRVSIDGTSSASPFSGA